MFHKYNALANCLKTAVQMESVLPQGLKCSKSIVPKYVYKPIFGARNDITRAASSAPQSGKVIYKSWKDIPDELIPKTSKRDPYNTVYRHPKYIAVRKRQIFYQQDDGVPIYLKDGWVAYARVAITWILIFASLALSMWEWYWHCM